MADCLIDSPMDMQVTSAHIFNRRQHLAFPGDRMEGIYRVEAGWLARYTRLPSGQRQITSLYLPGDYCEPHWIIDPVSTEWIMALSTVRATTVSLERVMIAAEAQQEGPRRILTELVRLLGRQSSLVVALGRRSGLERLSAVILELHDRAVAMAGEGEAVAMPLTQSDLADIVGITPIHVNRILKDLRLRNVIQVNRGAVTVTDPEKLRFVTVNGYCPPGEPI